MDGTTKIYITGLTAGDVPWHRMFTAYGTAEAYPETLSALEQPLPLEEWKAAFRAVSDFEHQSTLFPPAPFMLVFLVRILEKQLQSRTESGLLIAKELLQYFSYYAEVCNAAEQAEHAPQLEAFSDMLDEQYLLSEDWDEEELEEIFEDPDAIPDELFYSFYYYSKAVLSQIPEILEKYGEFAEESAEYSGLF